MIELVAPPRRGADGTSLSGGLPVICGVLPMELVAPPRRGAVGASLLGGCPNVHF